MYFQTVNISDAKDCKSMPLRSASTEATTSPQEEVSQEVLDHAMPCTVEPVNSCCFNLSLEVWERFLEPVTLRVWFWNPKTEEARSVG